MRHFADGRPAGRYYADGRKYEPTPEMLKAEDDALLLAAAADLRRQCDELRGLVREAMTPLRAMYLKTRSDELASWLRRARTVVK